MVDLMAFSARETGNRERQEDYAVDEYITTPTGKNIKLAIACDGQGGGESGEMAARLTARSIIEHIEISNTTNIPKLLTEAVKSANELVHSELRGVGTSTLAMIAVDLSDPTAPNGRLYIASVGDSYICLMRDGKLIRLNIDHNLANEYVYAGQMSVQEAHRLQNAKYPTRVIGVNPDIQVDIGFYAEKDKNFVNSRRAFNIGKVGMKLLEGDTVFVASDGMFRIGQGSRKPYVHKDEFLRHALDDDPGRTTRSLFRYAIQRRPDDNLCISMLMVPSRLRRQIRASKSIPWQQRILLGGLAVSVVMLAIIFFLGLADDTFFNNFSFTTQDSVSLALEPTRTSVNQIGVQFFTEPSTNGALSAPLALRQNITYNGINYLKVDGLNAHTLSDNFLAAKIYMQANSEINVLDVNNQPPESIAIAIGEGSNVFINAGSFTNGGVRVEYAPNADIWFTTRRSECSSAKYVKADASTRFSEDTLSFICYTGDANSCNYRTPADPQPIQMTIGTEYILSTISGELLAQVEASYDDTKLYYDSITMFQNDGLSGNCITRYLDPDNDGIPYPDDLCPQQIGVTGNAGCPAGFVIPTESSDGS